MPLVLFMRLKLRSYSRGKNGRQTIPKLTCCPITKRSLIKGEDVLVSVLNPMIESSKLRNQSGVIPSRLHSILITSDGQVAYPVKRGLLADEAIPLKGSV